jgi:hypothetical protein
MGSHYSKLFGTRFRISSPMTCRREITNFLMFRQIIKDRLNFRSLTGVRTEPYVLMSGFIADRLLRDN